MPKLKNGRVKKDSVTVCIRMPRAEKEVAMLAARQEVRTLSQYTRLVLLDRLKADGMWPIPE